MYLAKEIQYPAMAQDAGIEGKVYVGFIVEKDGSLSNIRVFRGIGGGCDEEAVRVLKASPKWTPGKQRGKAVRQKMTIPIAFVLTEDKSRRDLFREEEEVVEVIEVPELPVDSKKSGYEHQIFTIVEEAAHPKGGIKSFYKYIKENLTYPEQAKTLGIEGKVFVSFVVEKDGSRSTFKILRGIGAGCDEEAIRLMKESPAWQPAKQNGKVVRQKMTLPFNFKLPADPNKVYDKVDQKASCPALAGYIEQNRTYPKLAKKKKIDGTVMATFIVEKDGSLSNLGIMRGIGGGCDEHVYALLKNSPKWTPAQVNGKVVRQKMSYTVTFVHPKNK